MGIEIRSASTTDAFYEILDEITLRASSNGDVPLVHIECHGNDEALVLADGSTLRHEVLYKILVRLNIATRMRLFVCIAACFGAYLARTLDPTERAPFVALLSPTDSVYPDDLFRAYSSFYRVLLSSYDGDAALTAIEKGFQNEEIVRPVDAAYFFRVAFLRYVERQCTPEAYLERAQKIHMEQISEGTRVTPVGTIARMLADTEQHYFDQFRTQYFMIDLFPENNARFPITHGALRDLQLKLALRSAEV